MKKLMALLITGCFSLSMAYALDAMLEPNKNYHTLKVLNKRATCQNRSHSWCLQHPMKCKHHPKTFCANKHPL